MLQKTKSRLLVILVVMVLVPLSIWGLHRKYQSDFNEQFHLLNLAVIKDVETIDVIGFQWTSWNHQSVYFSQEEEKSAIHQEIAEQLPSPGSSIDWLTEKWTVFYPQSKKSNLQNTSFYALMKKEYRASGFSVQAKAEEELRTFYAKPDGSLLTLNDLIADKETFRKTLREIWKKPTELQALEYYQKTMKALDSDDWSKIAFSYQNKVLYFDKSTISISVFVESLNATYFTKDEMAYFRSMEESRKAMEDSPDTVKIISELPGLTHASES